MRKKKLSAIILIMSVLFLCVCGSFQTIAAENADQNTDSEQPISEPTSQETDGQQPISEPISQEPIPQDTILQEPILQNTTPQNTIPQDLPSQDGVAQEPQTTEPAAQEEKIIHQPRIIISGNSLQGTSIEAGNSTSWNLSAKNCSSSQTIENMKVTLLCDNTDVIFEKKSWYFERTGDGKTIDLSQNVIVEKKAAAGQIPVQLQFEYEDSKGNSYTSTETVNLIISQPQQAELVNIFFPESVYESDTNLLTFQVHNIGLSMIYNAKVRLEGTGLFPTQELFLGNMEAGASVDGEIPIFAGTLDMNENSEVIQEGIEKYGKTSGIVIFSYENENGEVIEQTMEVHTEIKKPKTVELKVEKEEPETNQWWITIIFIVILVLIIIIIWLYLRMKHFKKRVELNEKP